MFKKNIKQRVVSALATGLILVSALGTGVAAADSGSQNVGGGVWSWSNIPGIQATSSYYHPSKLHTASAQVGTGSVVVKSATAGNTAKASAFGVGTTRVWWNVT